MSRDAKISRLLETGERYLEEMNYEQALATYEAVLEIDPINADAYLGIVEVYIRQGEYEKALEYAQKGYDLTGDERLQDKIDFINSSIMSGVAVDATENDMAQSISDEDVDEEIPREERIRDFVTKYEPLMEMIIEEHNANDGMPIDWHGLFSVTNRQVYYLSKERMEEAYNPLIVELENYISDMDELNLEWDGGEIDADGRIMSELQLYCQKYCNDPNIVFLPSNQTYDEFLLYYYCLWSGDMDKCEELFSQKDPDTLNDACIYDEYGRDSQITWGDGSMTDYKYEDNRCVWNESRNPNDATSYLNVWNGEYDESGRIVKEVRTIYDSGNNITKVYTTEYSYPSEYTVVKRESDSDRDETYEYKGNIDKYGYVEWIYD